MDNPWIFSSDELAQTPSRKDGLSVKEEEKLRTDGIRFIQKLGANSLTLHYCTVATAAVFFHRFYMFHSFKLFPVYPMAATCLFLAGKVEETPKKSNDIVRFSKIILNEQPAQAFAQFGADPKEEILTLERILLQTLRFDLEVENPYDYLIKYAKHFEVTRCSLTNDTVRKELLQSAWTFLNDSYCTTVCLEYEPEIVAITTIYLACKIGAYEVINWENKQPNHEKWWDTYVEHLEQASIDTICHQFIDFYQYSSVTNDANQNSQTLIQ